MDATIADAGSLLAVILIDLALSADNAVAVALAAAALPAERRARAIGWGVAVALALRILLGVTAIQLLHVRGLLLLGGLALFWIAARMWLDLRVQRRGRVRGSPPRAEPPGAHPTSFGRALLSIVVANVALSLDNVLAVAGVARNAPVILAFGLVLSVLLMAVAASVLARLIDENSWIAILGLLVIVFAGAMMIWEDLRAFLPAYIPNPPPWLGGPAEPV
ncbi:MAG TPA: YjbE family putative metal transport protein [Caulobacterales bacterium]|nr:YjbE family putative metal transport protein [Caulobacterales bacterium]